MKKEMKYNLAFTAGALLYNESLHFIQAIDHKEDYLKNDFSVQSDVLVTNAESSRKRIKSELDKKIVRVENMLKQLSEDEEFVVRKYYMKKSKWNYVEKAYFDNFETHKSIKQLQAYRDKALDSMLDIINTGER